MNRDDWISRHVDLIVLSACYIAPLFYTWTHSPILTAVLAVHVFGGFISVINTEEPIEATWFPKVSVVLLCFKAFILSMMAVPHWGEWSWKSVAAFGAYLFLAKFIIWGGCNQVSRIAKDFEETLRGGKNLAIDADLHRGHLDENEAARRRDWVEKEGHFLDQCDGLAWCIRYEVVGTFLVLLTLGIHKPLYILGHVLMTMLLSMSLGALISSNADAGNLS